MTQTLPQKLRIGARNSILSRWQASYVETLLKASWPHLITEVIYITTRGDADKQTPLPQIGGKGLFTAELEQALRSGEIDIAVHSLKDLPVDDQPGLVLTAILERESPLDALVSRHGESLATLPQGAVIGTSSTRRGAQLRRTRPDIQLQDLRGNLDTRLKKAADKNGPFDAIVLAHAGLLRIGRIDAISEIIQPNVMLPAPGQGALAIQCLDSNSTAIKLCRPLKNKPSELETTAERAFLRGLGGGCSLPISALAHFGDNNEIHVQARVTSIDGKEQIEVETAIDLGKDHQDNLRLAKALGEMLAQRAITQGARTLLKFEP